MFTVKARLTGQGGNRVAKAFTRANTLAGKYLWEGMYSITRLKVRDESPTPEEEDVQVTKQN